jgi:hypothetical protein
VINENSLKVGEDGIPGLIGADINRSERLLQVWQWDRKTAPCNVYVTLSFLLAIVHTSFAPIVRI